MGVDLKLLIVDGESAGWGLSNSMIEIRRDYTLQKEIDKQKPYERPGFKLSSYVSTSVDGESCYGDTVETPYGERITYLRVRSLVKAFKVTQETLSPWNKAILAFLMNLSPEMQVALYWH